MIAIPDTSFYYFQFRCGDYNRPHFPHKYDYVIALFMCIVSTLCVSCMRAMPILLSDRLRISILVDSLVRRLPRFIDAILSAALCLPWFKKCVCVSFSLGIFFSHILSSISIIAFLLIVLIFRGPCCIMTKTHGFLISVIYSVNKKGFRKTLRRGTNNSVTAFAVCRYPQFQRDQLLPRN